MNIDKSKYQGMSREVYQEAMDLLNDTIEVLTENGVPYQVHYGTLIGAMRHNDIIPWDDDIDILVPKENLSLSYRGLCG